MADEQALITSFRRYARAMAEDHDVSEVLLDLTLEVTEVLGIAGAGIVLAAQDGKLRYATASSEAVADLERQQEAVQAGPCETAFRLQTVVAIENISARVDWPDYRREAERLGYLSVAGLPLSLRAERLGSMNLYERAPRCWSEQELDVAQVLADMAASYLVHERLEDSRKLAAQLQGALDSRVVLEQAKGILCAELDISLDDAFDLLRRHARNNNATLRTIATAVVSEGFRPQP